MVLRRPGRVVRELTVAEYRAMLAILAHPGETEQHRIQLAGLPSSTYNVVRRRVYEEGWLSDVMVPSPGPCGFAGVEFRLTRPSLSARDSLVSEWTSDPGCVLLWSGVHAVFGVFFRIRPAAGADAPDAPQGLPGLFRVFVHRDGGTIPSYFDYSGLWARFGGEPEPPSYPAGLDVSSGRRSAGRWPRPSGCSTPTRRTSVRRPDGRTSCGFRGPLVGRSRRGWWSPGRSSTSVASRRSTAGGLGRSS